MHVVSHRIEYTLGQRKTFDENYTESPASGPCTDPFDGFVRSYSARLESSGGDKLTAALKLMFSPLVPDGEAGECGECGAAESDESASGCCFWSSAPVSSLNSVRGLLCRG